MPREAQKHCNIFSLSPILPSLALFLAPPCVFFLFLEKLLFYSSINLLQVFSIEKLSLFLFFFLIVFSLMLIFSRCTSLEFIWIFFFENLASIMPSSHKHTFRLYTIREISREKMLTYVSTLWTILATHHWKDLKMRKARKNKKKYNTLLVYKYEKWWWWSNMEKCVRMCTDNYFISFSSSLSLTLYV